MTLPNIPEPVLRYATAVAVAIVMTVLGLVIVVSVVRGVNLESGQLIGLLGVIGTLVGILVSLLRTGQVAQGVQRVEVNQAAIDEKVTNHIDQHLGMTPDQVQTLVDKRLAEMGVTAPPPAPQEAT